MERRHVCTEPYKLNLRILRGDGGLAAELEYDPRVYGTEAIARISGELEALVASASADPNAPVDELNILTGYERQELVFGFNRTQAEYPENESVHRLFEAQVARAPEALAVSFRSKRLSYADLNARSNRLAHHLKSRGVGPDMSVGIAMERSSEMVVGLLGVLKAGGAYVPLDPAYPRERLAYMVRDAAVPVLLTQSRFLGLLPEHGASVICLDRDWPEISRESAANLESGGGPGQPRVRHLHLGLERDGRRASMIPHRGLVNYLSWCAGRIGSPKVAERRSTRRSGST